MYTLVVETRDQSGYDLYKGKSGPEAGIRVTDTTVKEKLSTTIMILVRRGLPLIWIGLVLGGAFLMTKLSIDHRLEAKNTDLQREFARGGVRHVNLQRRCAALRSEIERLQSDPNEVAYHARNQLGMVRPGEVIYQFTEEIDRTARPRR